MTVLAGWGADPEDRRHEVEVVNRNTGEKRTFVFVTPVGATVVAMRQELDGLGEEASLEEINAVKLRYCVPELADESTDALQGLLAATGGAWRGDMPVGIAVATHGRNRPVVGVGREVDDELPLSSSGKPDSTHAD